MKYTQAELEGMSDGAIDAIATHILDKLGDTWEVDDEVIINNPHSQRNWLHYDIKSFCNNWSDCGDLIDECKIDLYHYPCESIASGVVKPIDEFMVASANKRPKRAVTIVYILIKQSEK